MVRALSALWAISVSTAYLALGMSAQAYEIVYNPAGGPGIYTSLQAACDFAAQTSAVTSVRLEADWNSPLSITSQRTTTWTLDASDGDPCIASRLTIMDSIIPPNNDEGKLQVLGGWIGLPRESASVQMQAPVTVGAANVAFVGVRFAGRDILQAGGNPPCQRIGAGGLVELDGHAVSDADNDLGQGEFGGGAIYGSTDFSDCVFDFFFTAQGSCDAQAGAIPSAIQAEDAKVRVRNPQIPAGGSTRFQNGFLHAETSLVHVMDADLAGLVIVPGGTAAHPAPFLTASGTLLDGGDDVQTPRQIALTQVNITGASGGEAGAVCITDVEDSDEYSGVSLFGPSTFTACSGERAGAVLLSSCAVKGVSYCDFLANTCSATTSDGAGALWLEDQDGSTTVLVHTCTFVDNCVSTAAGDAALRVDDTPLNLHHAEFTDNTGYGVHLTAQTPLFLTVQDLVLDAGQVWPRPAGLRLAMPGKTGARVDNLLVSGYTTGLELDLATGETGARLLVDGLTTDVSFTGIDVLGLDSGLDLKNVNLKAALGVNTAGPNSLLNLSHVNCDDCATFVGGPYQQYASDHLTQYASQFVGTGDVVEAHQLKWSSPLLDIGVGTGTGSQELLDYDFDVTARDIGHKRRFTPETLSGSHTNKPVGWYQVASNTSAQLTYTSALPHGTVVRAAQGAELEITAAGGGTFSFGSAQGERTALVPRNAFPEQQYLRAARLTLSGVQGETLDFHGVLLNGIAEDWQFDNVTATLDFDAGPSCISFEHVNEDIQVQVTTMGFTDCAGEVRDFDFTRGTSSEWPLVRLSTLRSSVSITDCDFDVPDATAGYALAMEGRKAGVATTISECTFSGDATSGYPIKLIDAQPRLEENTVSDIRTYGLHSYLGAPTLDHTARNRFLSQVGQTDLARLVHLHDSPAWFQCGENSFVYDQVEDEPTFDFVFFKGKQPVPAQGGNDITNYHLNFWGETCNSSVSTVGRVPSWANTGTELSGCPGGPPLSCTNIIQGMQLLAQGGELEAAGNLPGAATLYTELITADPDGPAAHSAAQRLKAIAFDGSLDLVPADFTALAQVVEDSEGLVPAYLMGAAECLRAWQGDAATAAANLEAQQAAATDDSEELLAQKNRLEIDTYPPSGGLSRRSDAPRSREARQARERILAFDPETATLTGNRVEDTTRPGGLELLGAWPNPFNPATTLVLHLPEAAPLRVTVHNLAGQRVATLHQGQVSAGEHRYTWLAEGVASGIYLLRAETPGALAQQKVLLLK